MCLTEPANKSESESECESESESEFEHLGRFVEFKIMVLASGWCKSTRENNLAVCTHYCMTDTLIFIMIDFFHTTARQIVDDHYQDTSPKA